MGYDLAGEAMAMGERTPVAADRCAGIGRMAVGRSAANMAAAPIGRIMQRRQTVGQLDGRRRHPGEDALVRHGQSGVRALPVAERPSRSAGFAVDETVSRERRAKTRVNRRCR